jgi:putative endonuclease
MKKWKYYVYIMANEKRTIYIWVTNDLFRRVYEHKNKIMKWFTEKYDCNKLVWSEEFNSIENAIQTEKRLKHYIREWKNNLINEKNPFWEDLSENWYK